MVFGQQAGNDRLWGTLCALFGAVITAGLFMWADRREPTGLVVVTCAGLGLAVLLLRAR